MVSILLHKDPFQYYFLIYAKILLVYSYLRVFRPKYCTHLSFLLHASAFSSVLVLSASYLARRTTNCEAPHSPVFPTLVLFSPS